MMWSLCEFLDLVDIQGKNWCTVELANCSGFRVSHGKQVHVHAVLDGRVRLTGSTGEPLDLVSGDVAVLLSGDTHKIRAGSGSTARLLEDLGDDSQIDRPSNFKVGDGNPVSRLLSGRLQIFWPGAFQPVRLPNALVVRSNDLGLDLAKLARSVGEAGSFAVLDRTAAMIIVQSLRAHPYCRAQFRWNLQDPVSRALVLIEKHPFTAWTVRSLAERVGMGRSNFAARFTAQTGKTPIDALTEERMKYAEKYLRQTDLKVAEIGELLGYRTEGAFIRQCNKHLKATPSKVRKHAAIIVQ